MVFVSLTVEKGEEEGGGGRFARPEQIREIGQARNFPDFFSNLLLTLMKGEGRRRRKKSNEGEKRSNVAPACKTFIFSPIKPGNDF